MIVAVDANVLVSAIVQLTRGGPPATVWLAAIRGTFTLVVSEHVLNEVENTLRKPYFAARLTPNEIVGFLRDLASRSLLTPLTIQVTGVAAHPEDDLVVATAVSANADYLVTGDLKLQTLATYQGVSILSPRDFLGVLTQQGYQP